MRTRFSRFTFPLYCLPMKLKEGNIFSRACHFICSGLGGHHLRSQEASGTRPPPQSNFFHFHAVFSKNVAKQECIPVGCIHPAGVAVRGVSPHGTRPDPRTRHPPGPGTPQDQVPPGTRHPHWARHPLEPGTPLWTDTHL